MDRKFWQWSCRQFSAGFCACSIHSIYCKFSLFLFRCYCHLIRTICPCSLTWVTMVCELSLQWKTILAIWSAWCHRPNSPKEILFLVGSIWKGTRPKFLCSCFDIWLWKYIKFDHFWHWASLPKVYGPFRELGFRRLTFLKGGKSTISIMVILYITAMQILNWFENKKNPCLKINIWGIIDSIRKPYLFVVFWKIGVFQNFSEWLLPKLVMQHIWSNF